jgi:hypothetical protein
MKPTRRPSPAILLAALLALFHAAGVRAAPASPPAVFPVDSVRAGMIGTGLTVFEGTRIDTFQVRILGVLRGYRPRANLILCRALGPYLEKTGIIAGMSGSPIYVNGRLLGALSYTWSFSTEPVAGITPIGEMLQILPKPGTTPPSEDTEGRLGALDTGPNGAGLEFAGHAYGAGDARPIATPLMLSGFTPEATRYLEPWLAERGFVASPGGAATDDGDCASIVPGAAVGVELVRGDWSAAAIGTVTYRDGDQVLSFGHPFVDMGWVRFPFTAATIHTVFPNQQVSTKVGSPTRTCGTLVADRSVGISSKLGAAPAMVPVSVTVSGTATATRRYHFEVARSRYLTPSLVGAATVNSISEALNDVGFATVRYHLAYFMNGGAARIDRGNAYLSQAPISGIGEEISQGLTLLLSDHFRPSVLDSVRIDVDAAVGLDAGKILSIQVHPESVSPGDSVHVEVLVRRSGRGTEVVRTAIRVPPGISVDEVTVRVCDGEETDKWEQARAPELFQPNTFDQLVKLLDQERRLDRLYVQLYAATPGATIGGGEISQAPPSMLGVLDAGDKSGASAQTKGATLAEVVVPLDYVIRGCESTKLDVLPDRLR